MRCASSNLLDQACLRPHCDPSWLRASGLGPLPSDMPRLCKYAKRQEGACPYGCVGAPGQKPACHQWARRGSCRRGELCQYVHCRPGRNVHGEALSQHAGHQGTGTLQPAAAAMPTGDRCRTSPWHDVDAELPTCPPNRMTKDESMRVLDMDPSLFWGSGGHNVLTKQAVTAAFRAAILRNHPDHAGPACTSRACYINGARDVLMQHAV